MTATSNSNRLLKSFFRSYIAALLIPIIFCYIVYAQSYNIIRDQILSSNTAIISNTAQLLNEHYLNISDIAAQAGSNNTLRSSIINAAKLTSQDKYNIKNVLSTYKYTSKIISDIYIYYYNADIVISDSCPMSKQLAYDTFHSDGDLSFQEWTDQMRRQGLQNMTTFKSAGTSFPAYIQTLPMKEALSLATMVIIINPDAMISTVSENSYFSDMGLFVYDMQNNLLISNSSLSPISKDELSELSMSRRISNFKQGRERYILVYTRPKSSIFQYVTLIPRRIFWQKLVVLRFMLIGASILILLTAVWLAWYLSKKNYSPVKKLLTTLQKTSSLEYDPAKNEYHYIAESIEKVLTSSKIYQKQLKKHASFINLQLMRRWITGGMTDFDELKSGLGQLPFDEETSFRLLLIETLDYDSLFEAENDAAMRQDTLLFIVQNVYGELFEKYKPIILPMDKNLFACLIPQAISDIDIDAVAETYRLLKSDLALTCITYVSDIYCFADISEAYYRALYAVSADKEKDKPFVMVSSIDSGNISYRLGIDLEQKTINYIRSGDAESACAVINSLFEKPQEMSPDMYTLLKYDIAGMLTKVSPGGSFIKNAVRRIGAAKMPEQIKDVCTSIIKEQCEVISNDKMQLSPTTQNIMNYISENYKNPNLDVTHIGNHFCITPHYISRQFREQTGIFLKDYINNVRIDASKKLLTDTAMPISDIALECGYIDSNAFIRVFKKCQGVTPGKFRELNK